MTKKKSTLVNESVIRRWGKLANMPALTENFLDALPEEQIDEEEEMEMDAEMKAGDEPEAEMGDEAADPAEEAAVEKIVNAVVDAISQETGVDIEVEGDAGGEEGEMEVEMGDDDAAMMDEPAMRDGDHDRPANRDDEEGLHERGNMAKPAKRDEDEDEKHDRKMKKEELDLEVIDDEELTEAVLQRVVERLLSRK